MLMIIQGSTPTPRTPEWENVPEEEKQRVFADHKAVNETPGVTPGQQLQTPRRRPPCVCRTARR
jgi:hypothetical protein